MTPEDNDEPNDSDPDDSEHSDSERVGPAFGLRVGLSAVADLLRSLDADGEHRDSGRLASGRSSIDYDVSARTGPGNRDEHRSRTRRVRRRSTGDDYHVASRKTDDGVVVTGDLPGVDEADLTVGFGRDDSVLVIGVDGDLVKRVSLPWPARTAESTFQNGVLEIHLREKE